jgi:hypothetical protein
MVEQVQPPTTDRNVGKRDSADGKTSRRPVADRATAGDRPNARQEGGLLRELRETPRTLD